jgi:hypothetical protein
VLVNLQSDNWRDDVLDRAVSDFINGQLLANVLVDVVLTPREVQVK